MCDQGLKVSILSETPSHTPGDMFLMLHMHTGERRGTLGGQRSNKSSATGNGLLMSDYCTRVSWAIRT